MGQNQGSTNSNTVFNCKWPVKLRNATAKLEQQRHRPEQPNNPNYKQGHSRQRHSSNQVIKPVAAQTTTPWSNVKEWHNNNKRKQYCKEEAAILAMTTTKTNKHPIRIQNRSETTEKCSHTMHRHTTTYRNNNQPSNATKSFKISVPWSIWCFNICWKWIYEV